MFQRYCLQINLSKKNRINPEKNGEFTCLRLYDDAPKKVDVIKDLATLFKDSNGNIIMVCIGESHVALDMSKYEFLSLQYGLEKDVI